MIFSAVASLAPSATLTITARAKQMALAGEKVVSFGAGEPDFDVPEAARQAAIAAINSHFNKYTPTTGIPELKQAVCAKFKLDNNLSYTPEQVICANGAKQVLFEIIFTFCQKGDEAVIPQPFWVSFPEMVKAAGAKPILVSRDKISSAINRKTKLLILNYPANPDGKIYSLAELRQIAKAVGQHPQLFVISDECYDHFYYTEKPVSFASLSKKMYKQTITVNACSKSFSMTGWRLGYCAGPLPIIQAMGKLQDHLSSNPCSITQKAAVAALTKCRQFPQKMRREFARRRLVMAKGLNQIKGIKAPLPDGAFYIFADISSITRDSFKFCIGLLDHEKVAVIPGKPFGTEGFIRLSFATSMENIIEGVRRIKKYVEAVY